MNYEEPSIKCMHSKSTMSITRFKRSHLTWVFRFHSDPHYRSGFEVEWYEWRAGRQTAQRRRLQHEVLKAPYSCREKRSVGSVKDEFWIYLRKVASDQCISHTGKILKTITRNEADLRWAWYLWMLFNLIMLNTEILLVFVFQMYKSCYIKLG